MENFSKLVFKTLGSLYGRTECYRFEEEKKGKTDFDNHWPAGPKSQAPSTEHWSWTLSELQHMTWNRCSLMQSQRRKLKSTSTFFPVRTGCRWLQFSIQKVLLLQEKVSPGLQQEQEPTGARAIRHLAVFFPTDLQELSSMGYSTRKRF